MTGREFSGVDIDLLADYVGGALDGTPDEGLVAALITEDHAWRDAHAALATGMATVGAGLHALGTEPAPMPEDIASRITAALTAAIPLQPSKSTATTAPAADDDEASGVPLLSLVSGSEGAAETEGDAETGSGGTTRIDVGTAAAAGRARRRMRRWAVPVTVAASMLAFAGVGFGQWSRGNDSSAGKTTSAYAERQEDTPMIASDGPRADASIGGSDTDPSAFVGVPRADQIMTSGVDYRPTSFAQRLPTLGSSPGPHVATESYGPAQDKRAAVIPSLQRLSVSTALMLCLEAIAQEHGGTPITTETVDYARFEGTPALVVLFTGNDGQWAWVAGPDCGAPGAAADTRYHVKVG